MGVAYSIDYLERQIINEDELNLKIKGEGLKCQKVNSFFIDDVDMTIIGNNDLDSIISFVKSINISILFYEYYYWKKEESLITNSTVEGIEREIIDLLTNKIDEYNEIVIDSDFSIPSILRIFTIYEGHVFGIEMIDKRLHEMFCLNPADRLSYMMNDCEYEVDNARDKAGIRLESLKKELRALIREDKKFHLCTNSHLRIEYLKNEILSPEYNKKYRELFEYSDGPLSTAMKNFIDSIWKEIKYGV